MDSINTREEVINLPLSEKEIQHQSRKRIGYHVYLSYYFKLFSELDIDLKRSVMIRYDIWDDDNDDDISIDSTLTPRLPICFEVSMAAARQWNNMSHDIKESWKDRARELNSRPSTDGVFLRVPIAVDSSASEHIITALSLEWINLVRIFKCCILNRRNIIKTSQKSYTFGKERLVLCNQVHKSFFLNHLLKVAIFGYPLFSNLLHYEIAHRTKKQTVVHLLSYRRLSALLKFGGLDATTFHKNGTKYVCCAKVNLKIGTKNIIGFVIDEDEYKMMIRVDDQEDMIEINRPRYDEVNGTYMYDDDGDDSGYQGNDTYSLTQLWPIRIKINTSGLCSFILSITTFNDTA